MRGEVLIVAAATLAACSGVPVLDKVPAAGRTVLGTVTPPLQTAGAYVGSKATLAGTKTATVAARVWPPVQGVLAKVWAPLDRAGTVAAPYVNSLSPYARNASILAAAAVLERPSPFHGVARKGCEIYENEGRRARCEARNTGPRSRAW